MRHYDEFSKIIPPEQESHLMEITFIEIPVLQKKVFCSKATSKEKVFLKFIENTVDSLRNVEEE